MTDVPVALVTGGASGIGAAIARRLLDQAHRVAITGRDHHRLGRFAQELGEPAGLLLLAGDAADYTAVQAAVEATIHRLERLDTVVANAGFATHDTLADGDPGRWREMVLTNVLGPASSSGPPSPPYGRRGGGSCSSVAWRASSIPRGMSTG